MADGEVYATLLLNDPYLPGALVLAHSLRDAGTTRKLAVLVTTDTVSPEVVVELEAVYDFVIPVDRVRNDNTGNLNLMGRPDLHSAFTKIQLWNQARFSKIVYVDADIVALRAPEELFDLEAAFSAAPDIGWPDLFNTGVMVLTPNQTDYTAMMDMARQGISFDGADQGLINMYYKDNYNRISFTYNVTPSAHYQYQPAYQHFKDTISMVHFIGAGKPWAQGKAASTGSGTVFAELVNKWWTIYDKHYGQQTNTTEAKESHLVRYFVRGEYNPTGNEQAPGYYETGLPYNAMTWDAAKYPPPRNSRPEADSLPKHTYHMSHDTAPFIAPSSYPAPPRNLWYNVPNQSAPQQVFPWEAQQPKPTRVFHGDDKLNEAAQRLSQPKLQIQQQDDGEQTPTREPSSPSTTAWTTDLESSNEPSTPRSAGRRSPSDTWNAFGRGNAWDEVPDIERYVSGLQAPRGGNDASKVQMGDDEEEGQLPLRLRGMRLTDFPVDRPSLPVTPAPKRRTNADTDQENATLPAAQGVPVQSDWDPLAQLQKLASQQDDLVRKLERSGGHQQYSNVLSPAPIKGEIPSGQFVRNLTEESEQ